LGLLPADGVFPATLVLFGVAPGLFGPAFFADFPGDLSGALFAADFFPAVFFVVFFTVFLAFFAPRSLVLARFFSAAAFAVRARGDLRVFFALRFLTVLFLAVATTISFIAQTRLSGIFVGAASTA
jgi:hypothetical protein